MVTLIRSNTGVEVGSAVAQGPAPQDADQCGHTARRSGGAGSATSVLAMGALGRLCFAAIAVGLVWAAVALALT